MDPTRLSMSWGDEKFVATTVANFVSSIAQPQFINILFYLPAPGCC